jgi:rapamycin-insensitive companion of mTOR
MQSNASQNQDALFSKRRMQETLTYGYFEMLGTLSKRKEGLECALLCRSEPCILTNGCARLLERFKFFTAFYHLTELRDRQDLIRAMIENLDYSM